MGTAEFASGKRRLDQYELTSEAHAPSCSSASNSCETCLFRRGVRHSEASLRSILNKEDDGEDEDAIDAEADAAASELAVPGAVCSKNVMSASTSGNFSTTG